MHALINRPVYMEQLISFREKQIIKVVTGIRRCGKSTLFDLYCEYLRKDGVGDDQIIRINLEDPDYFDIQDYMQLYNLVKERLISDKMNYIFIDEVQTVPNFQKAVDGLFIKPNCDVYITGSNAYMLSGELATLLYGRYVEIKMLPLSFKEYISALEDDTDLQIKYQRYIQNGSFPYILQLSRRRDINAYLEGIYTSIVLKDIVARHRISDAGMLDSVIRFMFDNIGNLCSATNIANTMTSKGRKISAPTVENYLSALVDSFVLYKAGMMLRENSTLLPAASIISPTLVCVTICLAASGPIWGIFLKISYIWSCCAGVMKYTLGKLVRQRLILSQ